MPRRTFIRRVHGSKHRRWTSGLSSSFLRHFLLALFVILSVTLYIVKQRGEFSAGNTANQEQLAVESSLLVQQFAKDFKVDKLIGKSDLGEVATHILEKSLDKLDLEAALVRWLEQNVDVQQLLNQWMENRTHSGRLAIQAPRRESFPEFLPNTVLFTITNKGYTLLAKNLITSLAYLDLGKYLVVVSLEPEAIEEIEGFDLFSGQTLLLGNSKATSWASHKTKEFKENGSKTKIKALAYFLEQGINVFYMDGDIVVLRDFREALSENDLNTMDVIIQDDFNVESKKKRFTPCTGFMYIQSSAKTLEFTDLEANAALWGKAVGDQMYLLNFFKKWKVKLLPQSDFPNGSYLYKRIKTKKALWNNKPYIVHVNFVVGGKKLTKLREYGVLFYDEEEKNTSGEKRIANVKNVELEFTEFLPNTVLLTMTNSGYATMAKNLIASLERLGLGIYLVVATFEQAAKREIESMRGFSGETLLLGHENPSEWANHQTAEFKSHGSFKKLQAIKHFLSEGVDVFWMDGDVAVLRDFRSEFSREDMYTYDAIVQDDNDARSKKNSFHPGTGFMWLKSSTTTLSALDLESHSKWWNEAIGDQAYLTNFLRKWNVKRLSMPKFPNGAYLFYKIKTKEELAVRQPYIVHMNWVIGKDKLEKHRQFGTLFYDEDGT